MFLRAKLIVLVNRKANGYLLEGLGFGVCHYLKMILKLHYHYRPGKITSRKCGSRFELLENFIIIKFLLKK